MMRSLSGLGFRGFSSADAMSNLVMKLQATGDALKRWSVR